MGGVHAGGIHFNLIIVFKIIFLIWILYDKLNSFCVISYVMDLMSVIRKCVRAIFCVLSVLEQAKLDKVIPG